MFLSMILSITLSLMISLDMLCYVRFRNCLFIGLDDAGC